MLKKINYVQKEENKYHYNSVFLIYRMCSLFISCGDDYTDIGISMSFFPLLLPVLNSIHNSLHLSQRTMALRCASLLVYSPDSKHLLLDRREYQEGLQVNDRTYSEYTGTSEERERETRETFTVHVCMSVRVVTV